MAGRQIQCPRCKATCGFRIVEIQDNAAGDVLLVGGLLGYFAHKSSLQNNLQCEHCRYVFKPRESNKVITVITTILLVVAGLLLVAILYLS